MAKPQGIIKLIAFPGVHLDNFPVKPYIDFVTMRYFSFSNHYKRSRKPVGQHPVPCPRFF